MDYVLSGFGDATIKEAEWLVLRSAGDGFSSEEEAHFAGRGAKNAIMWCGARMRVGVDLGDDKPHGGASDYLKEKVLREDGIRLLNDPHGLVVYEDDPKHPTRFVSASAALQVGRTPSDFEEYFLEAMDMELRLTDKETLGLELYGLSHFESAPRARLLTLVSVIEAVTEDTPRSAQAIELVEELIRFTRNSGLPKSEIDSLLGSLSWLKQDSISRRGKALVDEQIGQKEYDNKAAKNFFQYCYNVRSELVHSGAPSDESLDVGRLVTQLDQLVADLMVAIIK